VCRLQTNLPGPQAVIVVPHRELGVQICLLAYRLLGGSINRGIPGEKATLFTYFGPQGVNVRGILDKEEVLWTKTAGYVSDCHVVVGTPDCLAEVLQEPNATRVMQHTKVSSALTALQAQHSTAQQAQLSSCCCRHLQRCIRGKRHFSTGKQAPQGSRQCQQRLPGSGSCSVCEAVAVREAWAYSRAHAACVLHQRNASTQAQQRKAKHVLHVCR
jgi:hypothetical protein